MNSLKIKTLLAAGLLAAGPLFADNGPTIITTSVTESDVSYTATGASTALTVTGPGADYTGTNIAISSLSSGIALYVSGLAQAALTDATISGFTKIDDGGILTLTGGSLGGVSIWGATSTFAYSGGTTFNASGGGSFSADSGASLDLTGATFTNTSVSELSAVGLGSSVSGTGLTVTRAIADNGGVVNLSGGSVNSINLYGPGSVNLSGGATVNNGGGGAFMVSNGATLNLDTLALASTSVSQLNANGSGSVVSGTGLTVSAAGASFGGVVNLSGGSVRSITLYGSGSAVNLSGGATANNGGGGFFTVSDGATLNLDTLPLASTTVYQLSASGSGSVISGTGLTVTIAIAGNGGVVNLGAGTTVINTVINSGGILKGIGNAGNLTLAAGGILAPGNSPGTLNAGNVTWAGEAIYEWEINNLIGAAGTAFDQLVASGTLDIYATDVNKFVLKVIGLDGSNTSGAVQNWDPNADASWIIAQAEGGVTGFDAAKFDIQTGQFTDNNAISGDFSVSLSEDGKSLRLNYTTTAVPEPGTYGLLGAGALAAAAMVRRRKRA